MAELQSLTGGVRETPVLMIDDEFLVGFQRNKWAEKLTGLGLISDPD